MHLTATRRTRSRRTLSLLLVCALALAACGGDDDTASSGGGDGGSASGPSSATLTVGNVIAPNSLDPAIAASAGDYQYLYLLFDRLVGLDPETLELRPGLATEWAFEGDDDLEFRMQLREGVTFHDGTPFDGAAVKASVERFVERGALMPIPQVEEVEVIGDHEVLFHLSEQYSDLPYALADAGGMIVSPASLEGGDDAVATNPVGTGPYSFVSQNPGASLTLQRFEDYWDHDEGRPETFEWQFFDSSVSMVNALRSDEIDGAMYLPASDIESVESAGLTVNVSESILFNQMYFNANVAPTDDPTVRQAVNLAIDRDAINQVGSEGYGVPAHQAFPPTYRFHNDGLDDIAHDPDAARKLLDDAGYGDVSFTCVTYPGTGMDVVAPVLVNLLAEAGIQLDVQEYALSQAISEYFRTDGPSCFLGGIGLLTPHATLGSILGEESYFNAGKVSYGADEALDELLRTYDEAEREQVTDEILRIARDEWAHAPLFFRPNIVALDEAVEGFVPAILANDPSTLRFRG